MYIQKCKYSREAGMVAVNASFSGYIVSKMVTLLNKISPTLTELDRRETVSVCVSVCVCVLLLECVVRAKSFGFFKRPFIVI